MRSEVDSTQLQQVSDRRWTAVVRWLAQAIPYTLLAFIACAATGALDVERRAYIATLAGNIIAGVFVIAAPLVVLLGIAAMRRREIRWIGQAQALAMVCAGFSFFLLMVVPGIATKLSIDRDMRVIFGPDYVRISGATGAELPDYLSQSMAPDYRPSRVYLDNGGGDVAAGQEAAQLLQTRGVQVAIVDGTCSSACAFMVQLFPNRYLSSEGRLGFHDVHAYAGSGEDNERVRAGLIARFVAQGLRPEVAASLFETRELVFPARDELLRDKLITGCWDDAAKAPVTCTGSAP